MISVIIVTYNGSKYIDKCMGSIEEAGADLDLSVTVVDNHSSDNTLDVLRKYEAEVIALNDNIGFGAANNVALKKNINKGFEFFLLLNQDAYLRKDTIKELVRAHKKASGRYGIISPIHLNGAGDRLDPLFEKTYARPQRCPDFYSDLIAKSSDEWKNLYEIEFINAAAWLMPESTIKEVGGFDPIFFHYGEDNNYINRCKHKGLTIGVCPRAFVCHDRGIVKNEMRTYREEFRTKLIGWTNPANDSDYDEISRRYKRHIFGYGWRMKWKQMKLIKEEYHWFKNMRSELDKRKEIYNTEYAFLEDHRSSVQLGYGQPTLKQHESKA